MSGADCDPSDDHAKTGEAIARSPRESVLLSAQISGFTAAPPTRHRVRDVSTTGARVDHAASLKVGSTVLVSVGTLEAVGATVIWVRDEMAGLRFAEPINPDAARSKAFVPPRGHLDRAGGTSVWNPPRMAAGWAANMQNPYDK